MKSCITFTNRYTVSSAWSCALAIYFLPSNIIVVIQVLFFYQIYTVTKLNGFLATIPSIFIDIFSKIHSFDILFHDITDYMILMNLVVVGLLFFPMPPCTQLFGCTN